MDMKKLRDVAEDLFKKKAPLNSLHQELADNFYPERADFTVSRSLGTDFAANIMSSFPVVCRRKLGNQFGTMLRPTAKPWFHTVRRHVEVEAEKVENKTWLQWFEQTQRRAMYDQHSQFTRAAKEADHDFACFGQYAKSIEFDPGDEARHFPSLLYRCWHLRDMAWQEDRRGNIGFVVRKWKPTAQTLLAQFGSKAHDKVHQLAGKTPFEEVEVMHMVVPAEMYDGNAQGRPRMSIYYDTQNDHIMAETPIRGRHYIIPRWQTVSGSQYSYSPAAVCALPDARLLQAMTFTLLEAGEKATSPPVLATQNAVRSDLALYAGGVTWVDEEYDERLGAALRPLEQDFRGFNYGLEMNRDTRQMLEAAFFLNDLRMPDRTPEMTAYEVGQRVQEYIRSALPIFEPMETECNAAECEETFNLMLEHGGFGPVSAWPRDLQMALQGEGLGFTFESPLHDAIEQVKGQQFQEAGALIGSAIALDPSCAFLPKTETMLRDALLGIGAPAAWLNTDAYVKEQRANQQAMQVQAQKLAALEQASNAAKNLGQSGMMQPAAAA